MPRHIAVDGLLSSFAVIVALSFCASTSSASNDRLKIKDNTQLHSGDPSSDLQELRMVNEFSSVKGQRASIFKLDTSKPRGVYNQTNKVRILKIPGSFFYKPRKEREGFGTTTSRRTLERLNKIERTKDPNKHFSIRVPNYKERSETLILYPGRTQFPKGMKYKTKKEYKPKRQPKKMHNQRLKLQRSDDQAVTSSNINRILLKQGTASRHKMGKNCPTKYFPGLKHINDKRGNLFPISRTYAHLREKYNLNRDRSGEYEENDSSARPRIKNPANPHIKDHLTHRKRIKGFKTTKNGKTRKESSKRVINKFDPQKVKIQSKRRHSNRSGKISFGKFSRLKNNRMKSVQRDNIRDGSERNIFRTIFNNTRPKMKSIKDRKETKVEPEIRNNTKEAGFSNEYTHSKTIDEISKLEHINKESVKPAAKEEELKKYAIRSQLYYQLKDRFYPYAGGYFLKYRKQPIKHKNTVHSHNSQNIWNIPESDVNVKYAGHNNAHRKEAKSRLKRIKNALKNIFTYLILDRSKILPSKGIKGSTNPSLNRSLEKSFKDEIHFNMSSDQMKMQRNFDILMRNHSVLFGTDLNTTSKINDTENQHSIFRPNQLIYFETSNISPYSEKVFSKMVEKISTNLHALRLHFNTRYSGPTKARNGIGDYTENSSINRTSTNDSPINSSQYAQNVFSKRTFYVNATFASNIPTEHNEEQTSDHNSTPDESKLLDNLKNIASFNSSEDAYSKKHIVATWRGMSHRVEAIGSANNCILSSTFSDFNFTERSADTLKNYHIPNLKLKIKSSTSTSTKFSKDTLETSAHRLRYGNKTSDKNSQPKKTRTGGSHLQYFWTIIHGRNEMNTISNFDRNISNILNVNKIKNSNIRRNLTTNSKIHQILLDVNTDHTRRKKMKYIDWNLHNNSSTAKNYERGHGRFYEYHKIDEGSNNGGRISSHDHLIWSNIHSKSINNALINTDKSPEKHVSSDPPGTKVEGSPTANRSHYLDMHLNKISRTEKEHFDLNSRNNSSTRKIYEITTVDRRKFEECGETVQGCRIDLPPATRSSAHLETIKGSLVNIYKPFELSIHPGAKVGGNPIASRLDERLNETARTENRFDLNSRNNTPTAKGTVAQRGKSSKYRQSVQRKSAYSSSHDSLPTTPSNIHSETIIDDLRRDAANTELYLEPISPNHSGTKAILQPNDNFTRQKESDENTTLDTSALQVITEDQYNTEELVGNEETIHPWLMFSFNSINTWMTCSGANLTQVFLGEGDRDLGYYLPRDELSFDEMAFIDPSLSPIALIARAIKWILLGWFFLGVLFMSIVVIAFTQVKDTHGYVYIKEKIAQNGAFRNLVSAFSFVSPESLDVPELDLRSPLSNCSSLVSLRSVVRDSLKDDPLYDWVVVEKFLLERE